MLPGSNSTISRPLKVVVIGPCASGKSTLAEHLRIMGFEAYVCGQEHSIIGDLWNHQGPDCVIALDVDIETIRKRRGETWPANLYLTQLKRLEPAMENAGVVIDTARYDEQSTVRLALEFLEECGNSLH